MPEPVHVLVGGWEAPGATSAVLRDARIGVLVDLLAGHDVALRAWPTVRFMVPPESVDRPDLAAKRGALTVDAEELLWADVVVLRASDLAAERCLGCGALGFDPGAMARHVTVTGHSSAPSPASPVRWLLDAAEANPLVLRNRALLFDLDEGLPAVDAGGALRSEIVQRAIRLADLVVAATPRGMSAVGDSASARLIGHAADLSWAPPPSRGAGPGERIAAYGAGDAWTIATLARRLDPAGLRQPVVSVDFETSSGGSGSGHVALPLAVDQAPTALRAIGAEAALLPALPHVEPATELQWLLATVAAIPCVASRGPDGPVPRAQDGVDALLATSAREWRDAVSRLAASPSLRAEIVGHARERVASRYSLVDRAAEWAEAFAWAAAHPGAGRARVISTRRAPGARPAPRAAADVHAIENPHDAAAVALGSDPGAALAHRRRARLAAALDAERLAELRGERDVCWSESMPSEPLVSVVMPTYSRGRILTERSLASILAQTYRNLEVVIVGDHATAETKAAIASVRDPRVRFVDLPERSPYHEVPFLRWLQVGTRPFNRAVELARGDWIAPTADDDEFTPDHIELLLSVALEYRLELVYGDFLMETPAGDWRRVGEWPPRESAICGGTTLYSSALKFIEMDESCWLDLEPNDWNLWRRMLDAGVRAGHVPEVVFRHFAEGREWRAAQAEPSARSA